MTDIFQALLDQPNIDPRFKAAIGIEPSPIYYETLPAPVKNPVRDEIERIVCEHIPFKILDEYPTEDMVTELERLVNREVLDKADRIVRRLQEHRN